MDKKLKDFVKSEKSRLAEAHISEIAAYMVAARKLQARRLEKPNFSTAEQAKEDKLNAALLDRWVKYLEPSSKVSQKLTALDSWRKLPVPPKGTAEVGADVVDTAKAFQQHVQALANNSKEDKSKAEVLDSLFGDKGVFAVGDGELMGKLPTEKKKEMEA
jgi:hypothetical protein